MPDTAEAVAGLWQGQLVVIPTETVYGLSALASDERGVSALRRARDRVAGRPVQGASTWHASDAARVLDALTATGWEGSPVHRRALERLWPGPVTMEIELTSQQVALVRSRLRVGEGVIDDGTALIARVPDEPVARHIAGEAAPLAAEGIPVTPGSTRRARSADEARQACAAAGIVLAAVVDTGPTRWGLPSTRVRLARAGGWSIVGEGALDRRAIQQRLARTILFVCTGNTCRSPMAMLIAQGLLERQSAQRPDPGRVPVRVTSAGVAAVDGGPYTPETLAAVEALGLPTSRGQSRSLTRELIREADAVFAMTASHRSAVLRLDPEAAPRVHLLDPQGHDIDDPIGGPQSLYSSLAARMRTMIERRLQALAEADLGPEAHRAI
jgi:L-threonylcarbamoyladenylate synthase